MYLSCLQLFEWPGTYRCCSPFPWQRSGALSKEISLHSDSLILVPFVWTSALLLPFYLTHSISPCFKARCPCTAIPSTTVLLLVSCRGQDRGHFVALLSIAPTLLVMMPVPSRGYPASLSLLNFHLFTALCLLVTLSAPMILSLQAFVSIFTARTSGQPAPLQVAGKW